MRAEQELVAGVVVLPVQMEMGLQALAILGGTVMLGLAEQAHQLLALLVEMVRNGIQLMGVVGVVMEKVAAQQAVYMVAVVAYLVGIFIVTVPMVSSL